MEKSLARNAPRRNQSHVTGPTSYTTKTASNDLKFRFAAVLYVFIVVLFAYHFLGFLQGYQKPYKRPLQFIHFPFNPLACSIVKFDWICHELLLTSPC